MSQSSQSNQSDVQSEYTAFISYRHADRDMNLARRIQRSLEHFRIPAEIREQTGRTSIGRIFRDQDELTAGNLTEEIPEALDHAEFLIVICSPGSRESVWVQNEVEYFLKTRDLEHIIIVLSEGEPDDVLPIAVLEKQRALPKDEEWESRSFEHVGCDFRGDLRKAFRTEIPRMAATILDCRYDDLVQRQKQYQMKKRAALLGAGLAGMTVLTAYVLYNNSKIRSQNETILRANEEISLASQEIARSSEEIQKKHEEITKNYRETQIAESRILVQQSAQSLTENDRTQAVREALSALPTQEDDRPYLPEAEYALADALNLYRLPTGRAPAAAGCLKTDFAIMQMAPRRGENCHYIGAFDRDGNVMVWDTLTNKAVLEIVSTYSRDLNNESVQQLVLRDETALLVYSDRVVCRDLPSDSERWVCPLPGNLYIWSGEYAASSDRAVFLWMEEEAEGEKDAKRIQLVQVDAETGEGRTVMELPGRPEAARVSADGAFLAVTIPTENTDTSQLFLCDLNSGEIILLEEGRFTGMRFGTERFYYLAYIGREQEPELGIGQYKARLTCYNTESRSRVWSAEEPVHEYASTAPDLFPDLVTADLYSDLILYDPESGRRLASLHGTARIMDVQEKTNSQLGLCLDILYADGSQNLYDYDDPDVMAGKKTGCFTYLDAFPDDIDAVERWEDQLYLLRRKPLSNGTYYYGNEIEIYKPLQADERFTPLSEADRPKYPLKARYFENGGQFIRIVEEEGSFRISSYDARTGEYLSDFHVPDPEKGSWTLLGNSGSGEVILFNYNYFATADPEVPLLCAADPSAQSCRLILARDLEEAAIEKALGHSFAKQDVVKPGRNQIFSVQMHTSGPLLTDNRIGYLLRIGKNPEKWYWCSYDLLSGEVRVTDVQKWKESLGYDEKVNYFNANDDFCPYLSPDGSRMLVLSEAGSEARTFAEEYRGIIADPESGECIGLADTVRIDGFSLDKSISWISEEELLFIADGGIICIRNDGSMEPVTGLSFRGRPDLIYADGGVLFLQTVQNSEYTLDQYRLPDFSGICSTDVAPGFFRSPCVVHTDGLTVFLDNQMMRQQGYYYLSPALVLDSETMVPAQMIPNVRTYSPEADTFLQMGGINGDEPGVIRRYTLEDLIRIGQDFLKDQ